MSQENVKKFREAVNTRPDLQKEMRAERSLRSANDIVRFASAHGFEFTKTDLAATAREVGFELTDFELEMVAGGQDTETMTAYRVSLKAAISIPPQPEEDTGDDDGC